MGKYAAGTDVSTEQSRAEIERTLRRYGADQFMYGWDQERAVLSFRASDRHVRFVVTLPDRDDEEFTHYRHGNGGKLVQRTDSARENLWEQACRQRWRALALVVKAKLEAVDAGIATFEEEFLAYVVLPDNTTVGSWLGPQIAAAYDTGRMPNVLAIEGPKGKR